MKITVWTLASDDDSGTQASVFSNEYAAEQAYFEAIFTEEGPTQREARKALDSGDYDELHDIAQKYLEGSLDTYNIDSQVVEVQCVPEAELKAEAKALPPADRAALNALPSDPEDMNDERAYWAGETLAYFTRTYGEQEGGDRQNLADLLADLAHYCDRNSLKLDECLATARMNYAAETDEQGAQFDR
jgi:hypothetical protein